MFRNAKVGDRVWDFMYDWGTIINIHEDRCYLPIEVMFELEDRTYTYELDGKKFGARNQTLFWDEIKFEIPEKPFNLEYELKKLKIKEFTGEDDVCYLEWDWSIDVLVYEHCKFFEKIGCIYFDKNDISEFVKLVNKHNITKEQFFTAYKNVFGGRNAD